MCVCVYLWRDRHILKSIWRVAKGIFHYNSPKPKQTWDKKLREIAPGVLPNGAKTCFVFFLSPIQRGLSGIYPALIKTMFQTTDVNRCSGGYIREKLLNFCIGVLQAPKKLPPEALFWVGCLLPVYSSNGTIFWWQTSFRGLVNIPRTRVLMGDVHFGRYDPIRCATVRFIVNSKLSKCSWPSRLSTTRISCTL